MDGPSVKRAALGFGGVLFALVLAVTYQLWSIRSDLQRAEERLENVSLETAAAGDDGIEDLVGPVLEPIHRADDRSNGVLLGTVAHLPLVGGQIDTLQELTGNLATVAETVEAQLDVVDVALADAGTPEGTVALADALLDATEAVRQSVEALPRVDDRGLIGPLRSASLRLDEALERGSDKLDELHEHVTTGRRLLVGPTNILVLASNNAEQRAGMGMHLSAGIVKIDDGEFSTSDFVPTEALTAMTNDRARYPDELEPLFGDIWDYGREWRTVSTTPNFPVVGSIFDQLAELVGFGSVDAVISVDGPALVGLLEATGPIAIRGMDIRSANVVDLLLRDNYLQFAGNGERRELQGDIAAAIFSALTERKVDPLELASELASAADGRHLLAWSDDADLQDLWETLGADGALTPWSFMISVQNATGSKRDYYLDPVMSVQALHDDRADVRRYRATATLANPVVEPTAKIIEGTNHLVPPGYHRAYVTFTLPNFATAVDVVEGRLSRRGTDGPTQLAAVWLRVPVGQTRSASVEFDLPASVRLIELLPSARVRPTEYTIGARRVLDDQTRRVRLPLGPGGAHEPKIPQALGMMLIFGGIVSLVGRSRRLSAPDPEPGGEARVDLVIGSSFLVSGLAVLVIFSI